MVYGLGIFTYVFNILLYGHVVVVMKKANKQGKWIGLKDNGVRIGNICYNIVLNKRKWYSTTTTAFYVFTVLLQYEWVCEMGTGSYDITMMMMMK